MGELKKKKGNVKKKERGSAILMVLMISTILIILSAVVSSSLVFTTRGNTLSKYKSDYTYAAEGGIEYGIERFTESGPFTGSYDPATGVDGRVKLDFLGNVSATDEKEIYEVRVECKGSGTDYELISTVYNKDKKQLAKVTLPLKGKIGMSKILEYTMASSTDIDIKGAGSINYQVGKTAYNSDAGGAWNQLGTGSSIEPKVEDVKMQKPEFNTSLVNKNVDLIEFDNFAHLISYVETHGKIIDETASTGILEMGLGHCTIDNDPGARTDLWKVIFIRRDNVVIKQVDSMSKTIIVTDGEVIINGVSSTISKSTIYASKITANVSANLHFAGSPLYDGTAAENHRVVPYLEIVDGSQAINNNIRIGTLNTIDKLLMTYMTSFGASSDISGRPDINFGDIVYEY